MKMRYVSNLTFLCHFFVKEYKMNTTQIKSIVNLKAYTACKNDNVHFSYLFPGFLLGIYLKSCTTLFFITSV